MEFAAVPCSSPAPSSARMTVVGSSRFGGNSRPDRSTIQSQILPGGTCQPTGFVLDARLAADEITEPLPFTISFPLPIYVAPIE